MASFGDNLRQQRELRGISLRDIAEATKISIRFLQALETGRVDILPGGIFRRSFVREYSRFVGLDAERMVSEFLHAHGDGAGGSEKAADKKPAAPQPDDSSRRGFYRRLFLGVVLAGAGGAAWSYTRHLPPADDASVAIPAVAPPMVVPGDRLVPLQEPATALNGPLVVTLRAREDCWVALHVGGRALVDKVLRAGQTETLTVGDEVILHVGDAGALDLLINDQPASPLGERGEVRKNIVINRASLPSLVEAPLPPRAAHSG